MGETVGEGLWVKLGLDAADLQKGLDGVKADLTTWRDETNANTADLAKWGAALAAEVAPVAALGAGIFAAASNAGEFGKNIKDNARDLGMSTDDYQRWTHVANATGTSVNEMVSSFRMFSTRMKEAEDPTSDMSKALDKLGVKTRDENGNMRNMNDILLDILPSLNDLPEGFDRNQTSMTIFGKGFSNIADFAGLTRDELGKLREQANPISQDKIDSMDDFHTRMALINEKTEMLYVNLGEKLIPIVENSLIPAFEAAAPVIEDLVKLLDYSAEAIDRAATGYAILKDPLHWADISAAFNTRQAARDYGREWEGTRLSGLKPVTPKGIGEPGSPIYINIINPDGTPQQNAAALRQAGRDLARTL